MNLTSALAVYFVLWWLSFFIVLPIGFRSSQADVGERIQGTDPGAPHRLRLWPKLIAATVLALVLTFAVNWALGLPWLTDYWQ